MIGGQLREDSANYGFYAQTHEKPCRDTGRECHDLTCSLNGLGRGEAWGMAGGREATWEPTQPVEMLVVAQGHGNGAGMGRARSRSASHVEMIAWARVGGRKRGIRTVPRILA